MIRFLFQTEASSLQHCLPEGCEIAVERKDAGQKLLLEATSEPGCYRLRVNSPTVSQRHARIRIAEGPVVLIEDEHSTNGTYLRIPAGEAKLIEPGSEVLLGRELNIQIGSASNFVSEAPLTGLSPEQLARLVRARLKDQAEEVRLDDRPSTPLPGHRSILSLRDGRSFLQIQWRRATYNIEAERWLREAVNLYNAEQVLCGSQTWCFSAASPLRQKARDMAQRIAPRDCFVLLCGDSGVGKEVLARDIHDHSPRKKGPFVALNCAGLPGGLIESELFGYEKGAFTDARTDKMGVIERAAGGTLFLDEIGEIPLEQQAKLLRCLDHQKVKVRPIGAHTEKEVDVRILAATNKNLEAMVESGAFRADLFYRLNVVQISIPKIEAADVAQITRELLPSLAQEYDIVLSAHEAEDIILHATQAKWRGGIRELRAALERYFLTQDLSCFSAERLPKEAPAAPVDSEFRLASRRENLLDTIGRLEKFAFLLAIRDIVVREKQSIAVAARQLDRTPQAIYKRLRELNLFGEGQIDLDLLENSIAKISEKLRPELPSLRAILPKE